MEKNLKVYEWIKKGKQVGKEYYFEREGKKIWSSVAIQKCKDTYIVYICETEENMMILDEFIKEEQRRFADIISAIEYIKSEAQVSLDELAPRKGQKIFNPNYE